MASRDFNFTALGALERQVIKLYGVLTISGGSGAVTLSRAKGILTATKESTAGQYTLALGDNYNAILGISAMVQNAAGIPTSMNIGVLAASDVTAGEITLQCSASGSAANPANGDVIYVELTLANSAA